MLAQQAHPTALAPRVPEPPVHIGVYDGPLELLLFLVRREGVDVREIPVARICDAYLAFLDDAEHLDPDKAGDYLVMAATLCHLKARELLPREARAAEPDEDEVDPREALARRLAEYERFRGAADELGARERLDRDVFARPPDPPAPGEQPIDPTVDTFGLLKLFHEVLERRAKPAVVHRVVRERFSLAEVVRWVLGKLDGAGEMLLSEMFLEAGSRARRIFTFLGVLEMARLRMVDVQQTMHLGAVRVTGKVRLADADLSALPEDDTDEEGA
ncbi:MAG: segregation and condensation protein A [Myxococcota bacterium]